MDAARGPTVCLAQSQSALAMSAERGAGYVESSYTPKRATIFAIAGTTCASAVGNTWRRTGKAGRVVMMGAFCHHRSARHERYPHAALSRQGLPAS